VVLYHQRHVSTSMTGFHSKSALQREVLHGDDLALRVMPALYQHASIAEMCRAWEVAYEGTCANPHGGHFAFS